MATVETEYKKINYKSDFDFILTLKASDTSGNIVDVGFPTYNFKGFIHTRGIRKFEFGNKNGNLTNCFNDNGKIHIVANAHNLFSGVVKIDFYAELPNKLYPDGSRLTVCDCSTNIELVEGCGDDFSETEIQLIAPYIKGDKGDTLTWDGMTSAQKEEVINSAVEDIRKEQITTLSDTTDTKDYKDVF